MRKPPGEEGAAGRRRVRVLFMLPSLRGGGAERVLVSLLRHIDREKFDLSLAVTDLSEATYLEDVPADVEVVALQCSRVRQALLRIVRLLWSRRPDVVFSTLGQLNLSLAILRPILPNGTRYIARETIVMSLLPSVYPMPSWWNWAYRSFLHRLDCVVCQSEDMLNDLVRNYRVPRDKAVLIHNPVDVERIHRLASEPIETGFGSAASDGDGTIHLVAAGSMNDHRKGFDLLIEALALCRDRRFRLTLLGDGSLRGDLERLARERGLGSRVRFVGFQRNPFPYLAQADAFVLSSHFEGAPNVVLEALACGTPVIATPAPGGVREILCDVAGCAIAPSISAAGLAESIREFSFGHRLPPSVVAPYAVGAITGRFEQLFTAHAGQPPRDRT